jgi:hypothetical protein
MKARGEVIKVELSSWGTYVVVTVRPLVGRINVSFDVPLRQARAYYIGREVDMTAELKR